ncbi:type II toxin-antitoxin system ParD family antitoxin [Planomonospora corallina]|uniref:Type II toxin-antitoxin system ParD family antitoxin n=1 Tax=Planomonospora corallina TaxID=1806052 RepID=A0ABV8I2P4_9ACTN
MTLSPQDVFFIEDSLSSGKSKSRSAIIREALRLLREKAEEKERATALETALEREYEIAFSEWDDSESVAWDDTTTRHADSLIRPTATGDDGTGRHPRLPSSGNVTA